MCCPARVLRCRCTGSSIKNHEHRKFVDTSRQICCIFGEKPSRCSNGGRKSRQYSNLMMISTRQSRVLAHREKRTRNLKALQQQHSPYTARLSHQKWIYRTYSLWPALCSVALWSSLCLCTFWRDSIVGGLEYVLLLHSRPSSFFIRPKFNALSRCTVAKSIFPPSSAGVNDCDSAGETGGVFGG